MQEEELKSAAALRLNEVLADVEARVQSGNGAAATGAGGELYKRLAAAVEAIQEGLVERDVEARHMHEHEAVSCPGCPLAA
jgi:DNA-binding helix-hairpin-helix protein with protein kinase domain